MDNRLATGWMRQTGTGAVLGALQALQALKMSKEQRRAITETQPKRRRIHNKMVKMEERTGLWNRMCMWEGTLNNLIGVWRQILSKYNANLSDCQMLTWSWPIITQKSILKQLSYPMGLFAFVFKAHVPLKYVIDCKIFSLLLVIF